MREIDCRSTSGAEELLSLSKERGLLPRGDLGFDREGRADSLVGYKIVDPGVLVMNKMQAWNGMFGLAGRSGIVSPEYTTLLPLPTADARFLVYILKSDFYVGQFSWRSRGMGTAFLRLHPENLLDTPFKVPPVGAQRAIADFLDRETVRIDALIVAKRRMIELLDAHDFAALSDHVIPEDAPLARLGYFATVQSGLTVDGGRSTTGDDVTRPYLRVANVQADRVELDSVTEVTVPRALAERATLRAGDVLMTEGGDLDKLGRGAVWEGQLHGCLHQNHVFAVRPDPSRLDARYLALVTRTAHGRQYFESTGVKTTNLASTNSSKILNLPVPVIDLREQRRRVDAFESASSHTRAAKDLLGRQLHLLQEHRQALITAAVTGEVDVQGVAA